MPARATHEMCEWRLAPDGRRYLDTRPLAERDADRPVYPAPESARSWVQPAVMVAAAVGFAVVMAVVL